jgi:transcription elongation factor Elf1
MDRLDAWITGGRYTKDLLLVTCPGCEEDTPVTCETEYGMSTWEPMECKWCGRDFDGTEHFETDEGPDPYDRWEGSEEHLDGKKAF